MWLCAHDKILTNKQRAKRKLTSDSTCGCCGITEESVIHALRDCPVIKDTWKMLVKSKFWPDFFRGDTIEWFLLNNRKDMGKLENSNWRVIFEEAVRRIWLRRNAWVFRNQNCDASNLY